jgi:hypothetical protein
MSEVKEMPRPTPKAIDDLIFKYSVLQTAAIAAGKTAKKATEDADLVKADIIVMVQSFGVKHAEKSKRLVGRNNTATITTGTMLSVDDTAVNTFKAYLDKSELPDISQQFFSENITYQLVDAPAEVLKKLDLGTKIRNKITTLLGACFQIKTKAPSLKVDVVEPEKAA